MNKIALAILATLSASIALAEDFKTVDGKEYKNVTVSRVEPDGIVVRSKSGISKLYFTELPKEIADRWLPREEKERIPAEKATEEKRIEDQKTAERERVERQKNAQDYMKQSEQEFLVAEQRASQTYQNAKKGTLSGQVFVSTGRGENFKLGAVQVSLFARDAIDILLTRLKNYAGIKRDEYERIRTNPDFYDSGSFYFSYLLSPIQTVETDAEGKFIMNVPKQRSFVIAAKADRYVEGIDITEHYYWLQPVSLEGQQHRVQNLSNNNLTSTTGTSSLILTKD